MFNQFKWLILNFSHSDTLFINKNRIYKSLFSHWYFLCKQGRKLSNKYSEKCIILRTVDPCNYWNKYNFRHTGILGINMRGMSLAFLRIRETTLTRYQIGVASAIENKFQSLNEISCSLSHDWVDKFKMRSTKSGEAAAFLKYIISRWT